MTLQHSADRRRTMLIGTAGLLALLLLAWLTVGQTRAIFSGQTSNAGNSLGTTSVTLTNNRGTALFTLDGMLPGSTSTQTIDIQNPSAAPMGLRLFGEGFAVDDGAGGPSDIADYLDVVVTVNTPEGEKTVFDGTLEAFAAAANYADGWWSCKDVLDADCTHQPVDDQTGPVHSPTPEPTEEDWMGILESTLRTALPPDVEEREELADFWAAVQAVDAATRTQQELAQDTVENPPTPSEEPTVPPTPTEEPTVPTPTETPTAPTTPTPAELYGMIPSAVRDALPPDVRAAIEDALGVEDGGGEPEGAMAMAGAEMGAMSAANDPSTPAGRGDRINTVNEPWSVRTYTFTVTMNEDAGSSPNVGPNHSATITFVWEGRA